MVPGHLHLSKERERGQENEVLNQEKAMIISIVFFEKIKMIRYYRKSYNLSSCFGFIDRWMKITLHLVLEKNKMSSLSL